MIDEKLTQYCLVKMFRIGYNKAFDSPTYFGGCDVYNGERVIKDMISQVLPELVSDLNAALKLGFKFAGCVDDERYSDVEYKSFSDDEVIEELRKEKLIA